MFKSPWVIITLGALLLVVALVAYLFEPAAFDWNLVVIGLGGITIGLYERADEVGT